MPQTKSAKKALAQSQKRRLVNLVILTKLKTAIKKFKKKLTEANFIQVQKIADLAAKKKVIAKNKASRLKSKLSKLMRKSKKSKLGKSIKGLTKEGKSITLKKTKTNK